MASVTLTQIRKSFDDTEIIKGVDLSVRDGEFLVLVGPSGCGKSTLLRLIAGLEDITSGELKIGDRVVNDVQPRNRGIGMVFQSYALYPHMTVRENMAFGLKIRKTAANVIEDRLADVAHLLDLEPYLERLPKQLSGGQRQRVAIGRAIVRQPEVFLFDEPLSNLDAALRTQMRVELKKLHHRLQSTMIYVTHDQVEAMTLANRIAVIKSGVLQQVGTPDELFNTPVNRFVAGFIGSPSMNFLPGMLGENSEFVGDGFRIPGLTVPDGAPKPTECGIRPQHLDVLRSDDDAGEALGVLEGVVEVVEPMGWETYLHARVGDLAIVAHVRTEDIDDIQPGSALKLGVAPHRVHLFDADEHRIPQAPARAETPSDEHPETTTAEAAF